MINWKVSDIKSLKLIHSLGVLQLRNFFTLVKLRLTTIIYNLDEYTVNFIKVLMLYSDFIYTRGYLLYVYISNVSVLSKNIFAPFSIFDYFI